MARGIPYAALRRQTPLPRIVSQPGKKNGLYWPAASEEDESPLGVLAASAAAEGYRAGQQRMPYHGYYWAHTSQLPHWRWRRRSPSGLACSSGILAGRCSGGNQTRHSPDHSTREDVCGSRATLLAIPSSAVCLRIDDFATSDQMGAREKSRPV